MPLPRKKPSQIQESKNSGTSFQTTVYEQEIEQWEGLVWYVVNKITPRLPNTVSEEELHAAGMMGLWKATRSYDASKGAEFKTYAYHRIRGAVLDELRTLDFLPRSMRERAKRDGIAAPAVVGIPVNEDGSESLSGCRRSSSVENADLHAALMKEMEDLPEKMRAVMHLYYQEGMKMRDIGERLSLTESRVSQIHANAIARLRRSFPEAA
ncbi:MAG: sigma-70 family RNA polymerase sigma factor [Planctomycetota bacterium]|nr:sigma-70 family RNA polymerase sigma factor [Planctomycetota bacterium]